jgi:hypothetical protein
MTMLNPSFKPIRIAGSYFQQQVHPSAAQTKSGLIADPPLDLPRKHDYNGTPQQSHDLSGRLTGM